MTGYILRRLLATIPVMVVVALFVFFLLHLTPGGPSQRVYLVRVVPRRERIGEPADPVREVADGRIDTSHRGKRAVRIERLRLAQEFHIVAGSAAAVPVGHQADLGLRNRLRHHHLHVFAQQVVFLETVDRQQHRRRAVQHHDRAAGRLGLRECGGADKAQPGRRQEKGAERRHGTIV